MSMLPSMGKVRKYEVLPWMGYLARKAGWPGHAADVTKCPSVTARSIGSGGCRQAREKGEGGWLGAGKISGND